MYPLFGLRGGGCQSLEDMSPKKLNFFLAPTLTEIAIFFSCRTTRAVLRAVRGEIKPC